MHLVVQVGGGRPRKKEFQSARVDPPHAREARHEDKVHRREAKLGPDAASTAAWRTRGEAPSRGAISQAQSRGSIPSASTIKRLHLISEALSRGAISEPHQEAPSHQRAPSRGSISSASPSSASTIKRLHLISEPHQEAPSHQRAPSRGAAGRRARTCTVGWPLRRGGLLSWRRSPKSWRSAARGRQRG